MGPERPGAGGRRGGSDEPMATGDARAVARIGRPHGVRGEVTVQALTDDPLGRFVPGARYATVAPDGSGVPRTLTIRSARRHRAIWLLGFEEVPDRTGAASLRERLLVVEATGPGHPGVVASDGAEEGWYAEDLVGLAAYGPSGERLGTVSGLVLGAAQDALEVRLADGRRALVPFVEAIVPVVDTDEGRIVVDAPPGLLDLAE